MTKITYLDPKDDAPKITWMGQPFRAGVPVEVENEELIAAARTHPYFEVEAEPKSNGKNEEGGELPPLPKAKK